MNNDNSITTKKCPRCGTEKPTSEFYASATAADGLQTYCKACKKEMNKQNAVARRIKAREGLNPALADFQPRELIAELRARGYYGELKFVHIIKV